MKLLIRDYQERDQEGWLRCRVLSFLHTAYYDNVYRKKEQYEHPSIELVADQGGLIIGLMDIEYEEKAHTVCSACSQLGAMIWHLAVHPDFQRMGIGSQLLAEAERRLADLNIFQLEAYTRDDKWVNHWYREKGFRQVSHYLHVFMEGDEMQNIVCKTTEGIKLISCFAHYKGKNEDQIKKKFRRVHECRCYRKNI
ncbi:MAG: GNAT family N-acetyltransferase [Sporolactobacillus sp.]